MTLLQLNRHIDDVHQSLPEVEQNEVRSWFDKQVAKARRFQPLSLFAATQKLRGLDVFEPNESFEVSSSPPTTITTTPNTSFAASNTSTIRILENPTSTPLDPDQLITRKHWQRSTPDDFCTEPTCGRSLGPLAGSINCRKCGKLFCEQHTMYQMKLSRTANHEPVRGLWARVCETCYKSRDGYNDHNGCINDHSVFFDTCRRKHVERQNLEIARLEKRLTKLTNLLANPPFDDSSDSDRNHESRAGAFVAALASTANNKRKALEQKVVVWEDDKSVLCCPYCQQEFGSWTFRRHHCRICGRVVCSDPQTACSTEVSLAVVVSSSSNSSSNDFQSSPAFAPRLEKSSGHSIGSGSTMDVNVRMCRECKHTLFSKRDFARALAHKPPDQRAYETLCQFERGIRLLMPTFQKSLLPLQSLSGNEDGSNERSPLKPPTHAQIQEASKLRKRLMESFSKYDLAAKRMRDLPTTSSTQKRLQKAVYQAASIFLHQNMLPLKSLPHMLRPHRQHSQTRKLVPSTLRNEESSTSIPVGEGASMEGSETSTAVSQLEQEERGLREWLVVLEEQRFMVNEMVKNTHKQRRFEEISTLTRNLEELDREIEKARNDVGKVEGRWKDMYTNGL